MRIDIRFVPPAEMRYSTVGDWQVDGTTLRITSALPDGSSPRSAALVAIHELVEAYLCVHSGITQDHVDAYDFAHLDDDEPGENPDAPYHAAHMAAEQIERLACALIGLPWAVHEATVEKTAEAVDVALGRSTP